MQPAELTTVHGSGMNGSDQHVEEDIRQRTTPSVTSYTAPPVQQPEPIQQVSRPPKVLTPPTEVTALPPLTEKFEDAPQPVRDPEPPSVPEPAPVKRAPETVTASNPSVCYYTFIESGSLQEALSKQRPALNCSRTPWPYYCCIK